MDLGGLYGGRWTTVVYWAVFLVAAGLLAYLGLGALFWFLVSVWVLFWA